MPAGIVPDTANFRRVAHAIIWIFQPLSRFHVHVDDFVNAHFSIFGRKTSSKWSSRDAALEETSLKSKELAIIGDGATLTVDAKFALDFHHVHGAAFLADAGANAEEMWGFCHIVGHSPVHCEDVICQVADDVVRFVFWSGECSRQVGNVFMVPRVAIRDRGTVGDASDLVAVIPPGHDPSRLPGCFLVPTRRRPCNRERKHAAVLELAFEHDGWHRHTLSHIVRVLHERRPIGGKFREAKTQERQTNKTETFEW